MEGSDKPVAEPNDSQREVPSSDDAGKKKQAKKKRVELEDAKKPEEVKRPELEEVNEEMLVQRLEDVTIRSHKFAREIEKLRTEGRKRDHDTTDMIKYLEQEVKRKDVENKALAKQLKETNEIHMNDKKAMKKHYEALLKRQEQIFLQKEAQLLERNKHLLEEVSDLSLFKKLRAELAQELEATKETIVRNEKRHKFQLEELEKKFMAARARLEQEAAERIAKSRQVYKEEVGRELDMESKQVRKENAEMSKELKFHEETSNSLLQQSETLKAEIKRLKVELSLAKEQEDEYAKRGLRQTKQTKELQSKVKTLEKSLSQVLRDFEIERESMDRVHRAKLEEAERQVVLHQDGHRVKARELEAIKKKATAVLAQRTEVEQFLLEALEQVKNEVRSRKDTEYRALKTAHNRKLRELTGTTQKLPPFKDLPPAPNEPAKQVLLSELSMEERERVLRLLFAKITGTMVASRQKLPPHSFDVQLDYAFSQGSATPPRSAPPALLPPPPQPLPALPAPSGGEQTSQALSSGGGMTFLTDMRLEDVANTIKSGSAEDGMGSGLAALTGGFASGRDRSAQSSARSQRSAQSSARRSAAVS